VEGTKIIIIIIITVLLLLLQAHYKNIIKIRSDFQNVNRIWGSHGGENEDGSFLDCSTV
jgi:hypothetical protein